jgi:hypothetical protein
MNMHSLRIFLIFGILHFNKPHIGQEEIVGNWSVIKVHEDERIPAEQQQTVAMVEKVFLRSKFHFKPDNKFQYDIEIPELNLKNGYWKFGNNSDTILIQDWNDRKTRDRLLMEIVVKKEKDKIFFKIFESSINLEMKKEIE